MHNLHLILVNADSAEDAASSAASETIEWGNDNNWRSIGGVVSEDGADMIQNHEGFGYPLSFFDNEEGLPKEGNYFEKGVAFIKRL
ncbi:MAG: hypothetical protein K2X09_04240, partial [Rickettsiales bacterium]|nr:hypothetical protein [Rickettsiales bacterium]